MKVLIAFMAAAGLSGCVAYGGAPYGSAGVYYDNSSPYYGSPYYGNTVPYGVQGQPGYIHDNSGYNRPPRSGRRDRDHDGVPNRYDRDRDGDGVPNRRDAYPNDPNRR
jgi:hypothetical protein